MKQLPEHGSCFICSSENLHNVGPRWYVDEKSVAPPEHAKDKNPRLLLRSPLKRAPSSRLKTAL